MIINHEAGVTRLGSQAFGTSMEMIPALRWLLLHTLLIKYLIPSALVQHKRWVDSKPMIYLGIGRSYYCYKKEKDEARTDSYVFVCCSAL